jgi:hypothetical protein
MTKPTLGAIVDDKPVKLTFDLPAHVHGDLAATRKFSLGKWSSSRRFRQDDLPVVDGFDIRSKQFSRYQPNQLAWPDGSFV